MNVFLVAQSSSYEIEFEHGFLWSPKLNKKGGINRGFETMKQVRKGDIILHAYKQAIRGISVAKDDVYSADRPNFQGFDTTNRWDNDGWRIDVSIELVNYSLKDDREFYSNNKGETFTIKGTLQQRYLSQLTPELVQHFAYRIPTLSEKLKSSFSETLGTWFNLRNNKFELDENRDQSLQNPESVELDEFLTTDLRAIIGLIGEKSAMNYLQTKYPTAQIVGCSLNLDPIKGSDALGYDIKMKLPNGEIHFIDVKSTTGSSNSFYLSANELEVGTKIDKLENEYYDIMRIFQLNKDNLSGKVQFFKLEDLNLTVNSYKAQVK